MLKHKDFKWAFYKQLRNQKHKMAMEIGRNQGLWFDVDLHKRKSLDMFLLYKNSRKLSNNFKFKVARLKMDLN